MTQGVAQIDATYGDAIESLRRCCCEWGLKASGRPFGHHQIWTRDSMIASLGARFVQDDQIQQALSNVLCRCFAHQRMIAAVKRYANGGAA